MNRGFRIAICLVLAALMLAILIFALDQGLRLRKREPQLQSPGTQPTTQTTSTQTLPSSSVTEPSSSVTEPEPTETEPTEPEPPAVMPESVMPESWPEGFSIPELNSPRAFVYDCGREEYIYVKGHIEDWVYPASTTKVYTAWLALQYLEDDEIVTCGDEVWSKMEYLASTSGLYSGDKIKVSDLLKCLMLPSGCDAAYTLAVSAGRRILEDESASIDQAVKAFVAEMNARAEEMGMVNCNFVTPDGYYRDNHYISLQAYTIITKACLTEPAIMEAGKCFSATVQVTNNGNSRTIDLENLNELLLPGSYHYRAQAIGLKTGRNNAAGRCMIAVYRVDDRDVIICTFGGSTVDSRYADPNKLFDAFMAWEAEYGTWQGNPEE